eukprot:NODE_14_length_42432_cov_0.433799.p21 type:complete len:134 gc:universal NODE_14_length_42432_cov_0.433799:13326-13727(+)
MLLLFTPFCSSNTVLRALACNNESTLRAFIFLEMDIQLPRGLKMDNRPDKGAYNLDSGAGSLDSRTLALDIRDVGTFVIGGIAGVLAVITATSRVPHSQQNLAFFMLLNLQLLHVLWSVLLLFSWAIQLLWYS